VAAEKTIGLVYRDAQAQPIARRTVVDRILIDFVLTQPGLDEQGSFWLRPDQFGYLRVRKVLAVSWVSWIGN
jgi:hypothetical protein